MTHRNAFRPAAQGGSEKTAALLLCLAALSFSGTAAAATFAGTLAPEVIEHTRIFDFDMGSLSGNPDFSAEAYLYSVYDDASGWRNALLLAGMPPVLHSINPDLLQYYQSVDSTFRHQETYNYGNGRYDIEFNGSAEYRKASVTSGMGGEGSFAESGSLADSLTTRVWTDGGNGNGYFAFDTLTAHSFKSDNGEIPGSPGYDGTDWYSAYIRHSDGREVVSDAPFDAVGLADEIKGLMPFSGYANFDFDRSWVMYEGSDEKVALSSIFGSGSLNEFSAASSIGIGRFDDEARFFADWTSVSQITAIELYAVPEPETWAMLLVGLGLVGAVSRWRARAA
ncbi:MAG: PEPxxWA-CTERM sorting domain-containing protein [Azoarcus sp.]|jgi:hypothetical protein|nr:PEPxxWA-CTERM sorting domain-containing protein [Azoarcus sp.]